MQRYNAFLMIHKALRAMLYDAALTIQQTDFTEITEAEVALEKLENVLYCFEQHAHHEDHFILPAIEQHEPELVATFEGEHVEDAMLGNRLKNLVNIYRNASFAEERINAGSAISKNFVEFMVFNLEHMAKEEIVLNNALWLHYSDVEILKIQQRLVASIPAHEAAASAVWMLKGGNNRDIVGWMAGVKNNAPAFVFEQLLTMAKAELSEPRSNIIASAFEEEPEMAF